MKNTIKMIVLTTLVVFLGTTKTIQADSSYIPSIVVTVVNAAPSRGAFQTPFWLGIHDGVFDIYNRDEPLGAEGLVEAEAVERLAEDGNTAPISEQFAITNPLAPQTTLVGPSGPFAPGDKASYTFNVDPTKDRYFSYASMVIPSNDAFIANGNPLAHELFSEKGQFVGRDFSVAGIEVLDAGTEANDEIAANTAFLNQVDPNIGTPENNPVILHLGLLTEDVFYPDGVLNYPVFGNADFFLPTYRAANFKFRFVDLGARNIFRSFLSADQEVTGTRVESEGRGRARAVSKDGDTVSLRIRFRGLSGPLVQAHLHSGAKGVNGPVVVDLSSNIGSGEIRAVIGAGDVVGPFASATNPFLALLNEMAAGNIYINLHTDENPGGEIRGQLLLR